MNLDMLFVLLRIYVVLYKLDYFLGRKKVEKYKIWKYNFWYV